MADCVLWVAGISLSPLCNCVGSFTTSPTLTHMDTFTFRSHDWKAAVQVTHYITRLNAIHLMIEDCKTSRNVLKWCMMYCDGLQMSVEMKLWHCWSCHSPHAVNLVSWWPLSNAAQWTTQLSVTQWVLLCYQICHIWFEGSLRHMISQKHLWHV